ncbi:MAG: GNAT family N-acetyltransferase [Acidobacteriaceae bacterium]|nr:GNAT family N-acetyltransferase [Acidobacteriaceae bacterium]MBV9780512.1 GNAT family N-acetyltransferase [Acidobacteriaceae bacterium]
MAALPDAPLPDVVELNQLPAGALDSLLEEEIGIWSKRFAWDFRPSADLLRRFIQMQSLNGSALYSGGDVVGYAYLVSEGHKGLIGDFYVRARQASSSNEMLLLGSIVQNLMLTPGIRRIESQLMLLQGPVTNGLPFHRYLIRHDRYFMQINRASMLRLAAKSPTFRVSFPTWTEHFHEETARVVAAAYKGHVDSEINDQYRTIAGARHFLINIVKFPGCGRFSPAASVVAVDESTRRVCGVCLASLISAESGHVTQLCVLPAIRKAGLGYELLRQTLVRLIEIGCTSVSLTVTCANRDAIGLYESMGFRSQAIFPALVWEGF